MRLLRTCAGRISAFDCRVALCTGGDATGLRHFLTRNMLLGFLFLAVGATGGGWDAAAAPGANRTPILLELFTSEGCSSCPPVDAWVTQLDAAQPVPGAELIVLGEHVDYWDHDGWKDPWSSAELTERQRAYSEALGRSDVYTPQVILDGNVEVRPWEREQVRQSFERLAQEPTIPVSLESLGWMPETGVLGGRVVVDGSGQKHGGDVYVAVALDHAQSQVEAGENRGRHLVHVAVARVLVKAGRVEKGRTFDQPFQVKLWPGAYRDQLRVIAFVQEPGPGRILGATMMRGVR
jgi:hypothetical protein